MRDTADPEPETPMLESGSSTPLLSASSLPNLPPASLQVAHDTQRNAITRRLQSWHYIKMVHQGDLHWFSTIRLSRAELEAYYTPVTAGTVKATPSMQKRATRFMVLGLSLGPLLDISTPMDFLRALLCTSQEYDTISDENLLRPRMVSPLCAFD